MSKMLIEEPPMMFQKSLAVKYKDAYPAIFLQQLHYWLLNSNNIRDGRKWVYKTRKQWIEEDFPFFSERTLDRVIARLKEDGILLVSNYNKMKQDKTIWYTIDYEALAKLTHSTDQNDASIPPKCSSPSDQNDESISPKCPSPSDQNDDMDADKMTTPLPIDYTENTQENTSIGESEKPKQVVVTDDIKRVVDYLNEKAGTRYTYDSAKTVSLLKRLFKQKRTVDEMKQVIDVKCAEWFPQVEMRKYLRPRTLFGDKFEDYLHQASMHQKYRATNQPKQRTTKENFEAKMLELYGERWRDIFEEGS